MTFTFLKNGAVIFTRSDAQEAQWTQEEFNLSCVFPFLPEKVIERGMQILFTDPATEAWQAYEVRQCLMYPGESYQQITAEDIAVSELTDCHIQGADELIDVPVTAALSGILSGTGWAIGTTEVNPVSSGDIQRGAVWQNVNNIAQNWNVYIMPRVTVNANGITGRYLDIISPSGTDRGLRLAINKNITDPCVVYDDSELYTALYGYGGTYSEGSLDDRVTLEYNFSGVTWAKTAEHPAKPAGQKYLEYPEMTALYGRNGKPRFGYYQNTSITDPGILLEKTWEALKNCCKPKISISGTVADLKRLGYADVPLRLHDMAIVELEPAGLLFYKQVVRLTVNLLDPTKNLPEIGDYIPNIIYINRDTENFATGGGKSVGGGRGGGSRGGSTKQDLKNSEYRTDIYDTGREIGIYAQKTDTNGKILQQAGMSIDPITGVLIYAEDFPNNIGSMFRVQSNQISAEVTERKAANEVLSSRITQTSNQISLEVSERKSADGNLSSRITINANNINLKVSKNGVISAINVSPEQIDISASRVNLTGYVTASQLASTNATINNLMTGQTSASKIVCDDLRLPSAFYYHGNRYTEFYSATESKYLLGRS